MSEESMKFIPVPDPLFHPLNNWKLIRLTAAWVLRILAIVTAMGSCFIAFLGVGFMHGEGGNGERSARDLIAGGQ